MVENRHSFKLCIPRDWSSKHSFCTATGCDPRNECDSRWECGWKMVVDRDLDGAQKRSGASSVVSYDTLFPAKHATSLPRDVGRLDL